jgi:hypothetical protein
LRPTTSNSPLFSTVIENPADLVPR